MGGFALVELLLVVVIASLVLAVALPGYQRATRRGKTLEAVTNLRRIYDSSLTYFYSSRFDGNGRELQHQFPTAIGWTPNGPGVCCAGRGAVCDPATYAAQWASPGWVALDFSVDVPFYYSYQFDSAGSDAAATFSAFASGDLNCDGKNFSLFQREGWPVDSLHHVETRAGLIIWHEEQ